MLTHMGSDAQTLGRQLSTIAIALRGVSGINPADFTPSTFSLGVKNVQEIRPPRVQNACTQAPVACHTSDVQMFHHNDGIAQRVVMRDLEVEVPSLATNLQVRLCNAACCFLASIAPFLPSAQRSLLAPTGPLRCAEEARMGNGSAGTVDQE